MLILILRAHFYLAALSEWRKEWQNWLLWTSERLLSWGVRVMTLKVCNSPQTFTTDNSNSITGSRVQHQGALRTRGSYTIVLIVEGSLFCFAFLFTDGIVQISQSKNESQVPLLRLWTFLNSFDSSWDANFPYASPLTSPELMGLILTQKAKRMCGALTCFLCIDLSTRLGHYTCNEFLKIFTDHYTIPPIKRVSWLYEKQTNKQNQPPSTFWNNNSI